MWAVRWEESCVFTATRARCCSNAWQDQRHRQREFWEIPEWPSQALLEGEVMANRIKVLIVDDSAVVRQVLTELLSSDPSIEVIDSARDPYMAAEKMREIVPDVIILDVEMPRM